MFYDYVNLNLEGEVWKDIVEWEEFYEVSNFGRIRAKQRVMFYDKNLGRGIEKKTVYEKIRKPKLNKHTGYLMVGLNGKGKSTNITIHSAVAKSFIGLYKKGYCVNHKDGNKLNNNLENLEITTNSYNCIHAFRNGLQTTNHKIIYKGIEYYSKAEFRRVNKISESQMNRMIYNGLIKIL